MDGGPNAAELAQGSGGGPIGVVLAGGAGRRLGGAKPGALLGARPLVVWVVDGLRAVVGEVVVAARADTPLPRLAVPVWREPVDGPQHPLSGLAAALRASGGRDVLACPVDLPFIDAELLRALLRAPGEVAVAGGQPLLGRFSAACAPVLAAGAGAGAPVRAVIAQFDPTVLDGDERSLFNVNTPSDLARAEAMLAR